MTQLLFPPLSKHLRFASTLSRDALTRAAVTVCTTRHPATTGIDDLCTADLTTSRLDHLVDRVADDLACGTYWPSPLRAALVRRHPSEVRRIYIETLRDQIVSVAIASALSHSFDGQISPLCFSYRPGRSCFDAACTIADAVEAVGNGQAHLVRGDAERCFESMHWSTLERVLRSIVPDRRLRRLILALVRRPARVGRRIIHRRRGIPQGAAISPLLSNLYLRSVDRVLEARARRGVCWIRYADDFLAIVPGSIDRSLAELDELERALKSVRLTLAPAKTRIATVDAGLDFIGLTFSRGLASTSACQITVAEHNRQRLEAKVAQLAIESLDRGVSLPSFTQRLRDTLVGWVSAFRMASDAESIAEWCGHRAFMDRLAGDPHMPIDKIEGYARILGHALWGWSGFP